MRQFFLVISVLLVWLNATAQLKPYTLAGIHSESIDQVNKQVTEALLAVDFEIVGSYVPAEDASRRVIVITRQDLLNVVAAQGGLTGFLSTLRVGITEEDGKILVSYTTPEYWANAYLRDAYPYAERTILDLEVSLKGALGETAQGQFGSKNGLEPEKLRNYRYMMGMPRFDDTDVLCSYSSYQEAKSVIENNITAGLDSMELVYEIAVPRRNLKLYGFGFSGADGEAEFMPVIDIDTPKHTAFLPYEFLLVDNEVHMLHGRYRIALSFPDLTMGTFMKIVSTPKVLKKRMEVVASPELRVDQQ